MAFPPASLVRRWALGALAIAFSGATPGAENPSDPDSPAGNPLGRDAQAIRAGDELFHQRCAVCHGQRARGAMAANLVDTRRAQRRSEAALFRTIRDGIPGTDMPPHQDLADEPVWQIVAYLRAQTLPGQQPPLEGDTVAGRRVFVEAGCIDCHVADGSGGFLGPALDSISRRKTSAEIRADVLEPNSKLAEGFKTVIAETSEGLRIEGLLKNENPATVLILTADGRVRSLPRDRLRSLAKPGRSRMPGDYGARLSPEQLANLLAYLDRQREPHVPVARGFHDY